MTSTSVVLIAACASVMVGWVSTSPVRRVRRRARWRATRTPGRASTSGSNTGLDRSGLDPPGPTGLDRHGLRRYGFHGVVPRAWPLAAFPIVAFLSGPGTAVAALVAVVGVRWTRSRSRERRLAADRAEAVPELVDLFVLAASAGLPVSGALVAVSVRAPAPLRPDVSQAVRLLRDGAPLADALAQLERALAPGGAGLARALADAARTGAPLVAVLSQVAATARDERVRAAEEAARRLPVTLLFPLAACVLPAAVLLTLVPVLVASLGSLRS